MTERCVTTLTSLHHRPRQANFPLIIQVRGSADERIQFNLHFKANLTCTNGQTRKCHFVQLTRPSLTAACDKKHKKGPDTPKGDLGEILVVKKTVKVSQLLIKSSFAFYFTLRGSSACQKLNHNSGEGSFLGEISASGHTTQVSMSSSHIYALRGKVLGKRKWAALCFTNLPNASVNNLPTERLLHN